VSDSARFKVNGKEYEIPTLDTFTLNEAIVLHQYSGLTLDELEDVDGLHPGVIASLLHVAIQRGEPSLKPSVVRQMVESVNLVALLESLPEAATDSPPEQTLPSSESSDGSESSSGDGSSTASDDPASTTPPPTGTPGSATPQISDREISAA